MEFATVTTRPIGGNDDLQSMIALARAAPDRNLHTIDLPYRLCSPSVQVAANTRLWEDARGGLLGWAVWQQPWITLDYAVRPGVRGTVMEEEIVAWGITRFRARAREHSRALSYFVDACENDAERIALLERQGFVRSKWHTLHLTRPLDMPLPAPSLPNGFTVRHLSSADDLTGYVELHRVAFDTTNMTPEWKARAVRMPQYVPALDIVAVAPDMRFAAFCVCWLHDDAGQVEPLGVHPDFARQGLGRALLIAAFHRLRQHGARTAHVEVYNDNPAARRLYVSVGFHVEHRVWKYKREY